MLKSHKWHFYLVISKKCCIFAVILTQSSTTMTFIKELSKRRSNYAHPDQATTQAKSLDQLSSGIYTEDERFIYELLQNAVDSFSLVNGLLDIKIVAQEGYLVFMHNGEAFSQRDVEGLCDVGNGNKMKDIQKIGYKGIGFKSVFRASNCVYIQSGEFCFKFDKAVWNNYWDSNWKDEYGEKDLDKNYLMPWQIIPIEATAPIQIDTTRYNVITYIQTRNLADLSESVKTLLKTSQFLLFLTAKNVRMTYVECGVPQQTIEKQTFDNEISLLVNGKEESRWLYHMIPNVPIDDEELRLRIAEDQKTPDKLKIDEHGKTLSVNTFDIAFAVKVENKDGERIVKAADNPVMYTYLPTSFKFGDEGFPFLVNANFITDAGREQLIRDSEWNKLLISKIPELYLKWVATFSREIKNYYDVLPKKSYGVSDKLRIAYDIAAKSAIETIPFIPSLRTNQLLKSNDAFIDRIGLADVMTHQLLFAHIERIYSRIFEQESNIVANRGVTILKQYGVFVFDQSKFKVFFDDKEAINGISSDEDVKLIRLLHGYCLQNDDNEFEQELREIPFILDNNYQLALPRQLCTQTLKDADQINADIQTIGGNVYSQLTQTDLDWLKKIGLSEPSDTSIIDTGKLFEEDYITNNNAISVALYLYDLFKKGFLEELHLHKLSDFKLLTTKGHLIAAREAYLSSCYHPVDDIEKNCDNDDIFISAKYCEHGDCNIWHSFFTQIGVIENIKLNQLRYTRNEVRSILSEDLLPLLQSIESKNSDPSPYVHHYGYDIEYFPFILGNENNETLSKLFSIILENEYTSIDNSKFLTYRWSVSEHMLLRGDFWKYPLSKFNLRENILQHSQKYPTTQGIPMHCKEIYLNTDVNISLCGPYLPLIDVNCKIADSWLQVLPFKRDLYLNDLLLLLTNISMDRSNSDSNKERISKIYTRLIEQLYIYGDTNRNLIQQWGEKNKIQSKDGKFYSPSELSYIGLDGFTSKHQVYTGEIDNKEKLVELLKLFGVKIYTEDNIEPHFDVIKQDFTIPHRLLSIISLLAILVSGDKGKEFYDNKREELRQKIENTNFFSCNSIVLTFKDSDARAERKTYSTNGNFYFIGDISPAKIEPMLSPLCSLLNLKQKERELFVLMVEPSYNSILDFLKEKEYPIELLCEDDKTSIVSTTNAEVGGELDNGLDHDRQLADSNEAKSLVLAHLESKGFDISNIDRNQSTIHGLKKDRTEYPLVVKSYKDKRYPLRLNPPEWQQLFKPNSMLWLHLGGGVVAPIKAYELFTYQDKLTLSFDTVNIMMDERVDKIMQVMRYFNNVHLNLSTLTPDTRRADNLDEYSFQSNNASNSDLEDNQDIKF